jgi:arsenite transporter
MVFVWSNLTDGEPHFTLSQVALNDAIMVIAFAPIVGLLLGLSAIVVPWQTLLLSVVLYIVVPVVIAQAWRRQVLAAGGEAALARACSASCSLSRWQRCSPRWCCCSVSRASRSSSSHS